MYSNMCATGNIKPTYVLILNLQYKNNVRIVNIIKTISVVIPLTPKPIPIKRSSMIEFDTKPKCCINSFHPHPNKYPFCFSRLLFLSSSLACLIASSWSSSMLFTTDSSMIASGDSPRAARARAKSMALLSTN